MTIEELVAEIEQRARAALQGKTPKGNELYPELEKHKASYRSGYYDALMQLHRLLRPEEHS